MTTDLHKCLFHQNHFISFRCYPYYFRTLAYDHLCQLQKSNNKDGKMFAEECLNSNFGVFVTFSCIIHPFSILQTPTVVIIILSRHHHMWLDYHVSQRKNVFEAIWHYEKNGTTSLEQNSSVALHGRMQKYSIGFWVPSKLPGSNELCQNDWSYFWRKSMP